MTIGKGRVRVMSEWWAANFRNELSCFDILAGDQQCGNRGLLCGLRGKPHRELAEWTRAPAAFLEMSELPSTYLLKI